MKIQRYPRALSKTISIATLDVKDIIIQLLLLPSELFCGSKWLLLLLLLLGDKPLCFSKGHIYEVGDFFNPQILIVVDTVVVEAEIEIGENSDVEFDANVAC